MEQFKHKMPHPFSFIPWREGFKNPSEDPRRILAMLGKSWKGCSQHLSAIQTRDKASNTSDKQGTWQTQVGGTTPAPPHVLLCEVQAEGCLRVSCFHKTRSFLLDASGCKRKLEFLLILVLFFKKTVLKVFLKVSKIEKATIFTLNVLRYKIIKCMYTHTHTHTTFSG